MSKLIDGKLVAQSLKKEIKDEVLKLNKEGINVGLAVILVGDDPASHIYVKNKAATCDTLGIKSFEYNFSNNASTKEILDCIEKLNNDSRVNGILCQLPLPHTIDKKAVIEAMSPIKDVDGFHPVNTGKMLSGYGELLPCTPSGIIKLLDYYDIKIEGKNAVVIGRSDIVGKPLAVMLSKRNATVTLCHSKTVDLKSITKSADILISAVGKEGLISADMVKSGATVIDVGINRTDKGLVGDVCFDEVSKVAGYITPVPGGVGPMTIASLMFNTVKAAKIQNGMKI